MNMARKAVPVRVNQLWDAISHGKSLVEGPVDIEVLMDSLDKLYSAEIKGEIYRELDNAIHDQLIISRILVDERVEAEVYDLPAEQNFSKGRSDWYCFVCHLGICGTVFVCEFCPRVFHTGCLPTSTRPSIAGQPFCCPACQIMAENANSGATSLYIKELNSLLELMLKKYKDWDIPYLNNADGTIWALTSNRRPSQGWRYELLVYFQLDLTEMLKKAEAGEYRSLEEFRIDCDTLIHSVIVYFGSPSSDRIQRCSGGDELSKVLTFSQQVVLDIQDIRICPDCFRYSHRTQPPWWFCLPCKRTHEIVWTKVSALPFWPAKVLRVERVGSEVKYDVRLFGTHERLLVSSRNISPYTASVPALGITSADFPQWNEAIEELMSFKQFSLADNGVLSVSHPSSVMSFHLLPRTLSIVTENGVKNQYNLLKQISDSIPWMLLFSQSE